MAKTKKIEFNEEKMQEIVADYQSCIDLLDTIKTSNQSAKTNFESNYDGEGKEITSSAFDKFEEHVILLSSCCQSMHVFVDDAWDTMKTGDETLSGK